MFYLPVRESDYTTMKIVVRLIYAAIFMLIIYIGFEIWGTSHAMKVIQQVPGVQERVNPKQQKLIVEFYDYRCPHCQTSHHVLKEFQNRHKDITIIYQPLPVLGDASVGDARLALAAGQQGRFHDVHNYLMERTEPIGETRIDEIVRALSLDQKKLMADLHGDVVTGHLLDIMDAIEALNITGTPTFMVGDVIYVGSVDEAKLLELLEKAYGSQP